MRTAEQILDEHCTTTYNKHNGDEEIESSKSAVVTAMEDYAEQKYKQLHSVSTFPTEDEIIDTILSCVDIRGVELEHHRREFTNDRSGLIMALNKLYSR